MFSESQGLTGKLLADGGTTTAIAALPVQPEGADATAAGLGLGRSGSSAGPQTLDLLRPGGTTALIAPLEGERRSPQRRRRCVCRTFRN